MTDITSAGRMSVRWDVINHADHLRDDSDAKNAYWISNEYRETTVSVLSTGLIHRQKDDWTWLPGRQLKKWFARTWPTGGIENNAIDNMECVFTTGCLTVGKLLMAKATLTDVPNKEVKWGICRFRFRNGSKAVVAEWQWYYEALSKGILDRDEAILARH